ncbi:30S ribosomal protein S17 [Candidatus Woesearchaeota archaeon]|nr:30S ribosomal protein S17 [Candidatus Woesearchaeota archaeon]
MPRTKKIGIDVKPPSKTCEDPNCPFHGTLKVRGKQFTGTVISDKMQRSATVEWSGRRYVPKYERYQKTKTRVIAHNPPCINASEGDVVKIIECRSLSKKKSFVIVATVGEDEEYRLKKEALEEGRHRDEKKEESYEKPPAKKTASKHASKPAPKPAKAEAKESADTDTAESEEPDEQEE